MENITETFVINLKECKKRMAAIDRNLTDQNIRYTRWEAVKGKDMNIADIHENTSMVCRKFLCNNGIIGCFMSHKLLWKHIANKYGNDNFTWFLVLEDDAKLVNCFLDNLANVFHDMHDWPNDLMYPEFIHLACNIFCNLGTITPHIFHSVVVNTTRAYLISAAGASKLVGIFRTINYHVDASLSINQIFHKNLGYYTTNNFVTNNDGQVSSISANSFPRILPDFLNLLLVKGMGFDAVNILFESPIASFEKTINVNIAVCIFILVIAVLVAKGLYIGASVYVIIEILYYIIAQNIKENNEC